MDLTVVALTFAAIFVVELPDKTFLATLVLSTRYRPILVWLGVSLAFAVQTLVAVGLGSVASLLPTTAVRSFSLTMFLLGAVILLRTARAHSATARETAGAGLGESGSGPGAAYDATPEVSGWRAVGASFLVLFAAEWGDLSQVLTLTLVARYDAPVSVYVGALGALLAVSGLAVLVGRALLRLVRASVLHYAGAVVCLVLAAVTAIELLA